MPVCRSLDFDINISAIQDMNRGDAECSDIIALTTKALNNDTLKWLLITVQEVNIRLLIEEMLKR